MGPSLRLVPMSTSTIPAESSEVDFVFVWKAPSVAVFSPVSSSLSSVRVGRLGIAKEFCLALCGLPVPSSSPIRGPRDELFETVKDSCFIKRGILDTVSAVSSLSSSLQLSTVRVGRLGIVKELCLANRRLVAPFPPVLSSPIRAPRDESLGMVKDVCFSKQRGMLDRVSAFSPVSSSLQLSTRPRLGIVKEFCFAR
jgi:hypothetical protein